MRQDSNANGGGGLGEGEAGCGGGGDGREKLVTPWNESDPMACVTRSPSPAQSDLPHGPFCKHPMQRVRCAVFDATIKTCLFRVRTRW